MKTQHGLGQDADIQSYQFERERKERCATRLTVKATILPACSANDERKLLRSVTEASHGRRAFRAAPLGYFGG